MQLLLSSGTIDTEQKALDRIEANSDAFVTFRYIYEKLPAEGENGRLIHWGNFAIGFAECLRRTLEELQIVDRRANL